MSDFHKFPDASSTTGTLHFIPPNLCAFEPTKPGAESSKLNTVVWIGGMFDTLMCVSYPTTIAQSLGPSWGLVTASLGSAGMGWGMGSLARDAMDMNKIISYLRERRPQGKIVLMGHSTGCQGCMEYLVGEDAELHPPVDGVILQASVSDRELLDTSLPAPFKQEADELARKMCRDGRRTDALPNRLTKSLYGRTGVSAQRWLDVSSPAPDHTGADDYFSSDLPVERLKETFGKLPARVPLLILYSGSDGAVPPSVDKEKLVQSWIDVVKAGGGSVDETNSGVVPEASHNYNGQSEEIVQRMVAKVLGFIRQLDEEAFASGAGASRI